MVNGINNKTDGYEISRIENGIESDSKSNESKRTRSIFNSILGGNATKKQKAFIENFTNSDDFYAKMGFIKTADADGDGKLTKKELKTAIRKQNAAVKKNVKAGEKVDQAAENIENGELNKKGERKLNAAKRKIAAGDKKYFDVFNSHYGALENKNKLAEISKNDGVDLPEPCIPTTLSELSSMGIGRVGVDESAVPGKHAVGPTTEQVAKQKVNNFIKGTTPEVLKQFQPEDHSDIEGFYVLSPEEQAKAIEKQEQVTNFTPKFNF